MLDSTSTARSRPDVSCASAQDSILVCISVTVRDIFFFLGGGGGGGDLCVWCFFVLFLFCFVFVLLSNTSRVQGVDTF